MKHYLKYTLTRKSYIYEVWFVTENDLHTTLFLSPVPYSKVVCRSRIYKNLKRKGKPKKEYWNELEWSNEPDDLFFINSEFPLKNIMDSKIPYDKIKIEKVDKDIYNNVILTTIENKIGKVKNI